MKAFLVTRFLILLLITNYCFAGSDTTFNKINSAGITIGHPGGVNLHYGRQIYDRTEVQLFAGAWFSGTYGLKSSIQYRIYQTGNLSNYLTFNVGIKRTDKDHSRSFWSHSYSGSYQAVHYEPSYFIGPGYALKWNWFMLTCDILTGNNSYKKLTLDLSLGYTYTF